MQLAVLAVPLSIIAAGGLERPWSIETWMPCKTGVIWYILLLVRTAHGQNHGQNQKEPGDTSTSQGLNRVLKSHAWIYTHLHVRAIP